MQYVVMAALLGSLIVASILLTACGWGNFVAKLSLRVKSGKWHFYALALFPSIALGLTVGVMADSVLAYQAAATLAAPTFITVCLTYHQIND